MPDTNFSFDFTDPDNPGVEFVSGDLGWVVRSQVSESNATPANLGSVTIDPSQSTDNFAVKIANGANPGAANVGGINLTAQSWTGYSRLTGGSITGDLNGDLKVKKSGSTGGDATFTIEGDAVGNIDVDSIATGGLTIEGNFGDGNTYTMNVDKLDGQTIQIGETAAGTGITIDEMLGSAKLKVGYLLGQRTSSNVAVWVESDVPSTAEIDLTNIDLSGSIQVGAQSEPHNGTIIVGALAGTVGALSGTIIVAELGGTIEVKGGVGSEGFIDLDADLGGDILINTNRENANFSGQIIATGRLTGDGLIHIYDNNQGQYGHFNGTKIHLSDANDVGSSGNIIVDGDVSARIEFRGNFSGTVDVGGDLLDAGTIYVGKTIDVTPGGDLSGRSSSAATARGTSRSPRTAAQAAALQGRGSSTSAKVSPGTS